MRLQHRQPGTVKVQARRGVDQDAIRQIESEASRSQSELVERIREVDVTLEAKPVAQRERGAAGHLERLALAVPHAQGTPRGHLKRTGQPAERNPLHRARSGEIELAPVGKAQAEDLESRAPGESGQLHASADRSGDPAGQTIVADGTPRLQHSHLAGKQQILRPRPRGRARRKRRIPDAGDDGEAALEHISRLVEVARTPYR